MEEKYKALFLRLAELLGWSNILIKEDEDFVGTYGLPPDYKRYGMNETNRCAMPNWLRRSGDALDLAIEHGIEVSPDLVCKQVWAGEPETHMYGKWETATNNNGDMHLAARAAIAQSVIAKLEAKIEREKQNGLTKETQAG